MSEEWHPPAWMYRDTRPPNDEAYFENMTRVIFIAGLSWEIIAKKWPNFKEAFKNFSIDKVAQFGDDDVENLENNSGIMRNRAKILATIQNAKQFQNIKKEFGSFQRFIDSLDKSNNYAFAVKELMHACMQVQSCRAFFSTHFPVQCWRKNRAFRRVSKSAEVYSPIT